MAWRGPEDVYDLCCHMYADNCPRNGEENRPTPAEFPGNIGLESYGNREEGEKSVPPNGCPRRLAMCELPEASTIDALTLSKVCNDNEVENNQESGGYHCRQRTAGPPYANHPPSANSDTGSATTAGLINCNGTRR